MFLLAIVVGLFIGIVVGALGAGGGILSVPVLIYLLGQAPHNATAESLVIVGLTALISLVSPGKGRQVQWRDGLVFGSISILGSLAGARLSPLVEERLLMMLFASLLLVVGVIMLVKGFKERRVAKFGPGEAEASAQVRQRKNLAIVALTALFTGLLTGFFGVGGGFIVVPMLTLVIGLPMRQAAATSLLVMVLASTAGLLGRLGSPVTIDWPLILAFTAASMCGGFLGGPLTRKVPQWGLTVVFGILLLAVAIVSGTNTVMLYLG